MDFFFQFLGSDLDFYLIALKKNVLACFWLSYTGFSISFLRTTFAPFPYMKYVFDAVTYRKYVLVRLQGVGASLNRETVSWKQCVFPVLPGQQSFWTLKAENHDLYKNGLLKLPRGSSITEVKSALLVRLFLSFSFSRVQASSFKLHSTHNIFYFVNKNTGLLWAIYHRKKSVFNFYC